MREPRLLVTGATGFVGLWTLRHWRVTHPHVEVWATSEKPCPPRVEAHEYRQVDLRDVGAVTELVRACRPTRVIHLAGVVGNALLAEHLSVNVVGTENLYNALTEVEDLADLRIVQASSAATYGPVHPDELPITEQQPPRPITPYALGKVAQDYLAAAMWRTKGLPAIRGCVFNLLGPGQPDTLVPMTFIKQLRDARSPVIARLQVGQTASRRDFVDVRDVVAAFDLLLDSGQPGEAYNIASGQDVSIQELIDELLRITGLDVPVQLAAPRVRAIDVPCVRADISKLTAATGWQPKISWRESLAAMCGGAGD